MAYNCVVCVKQVPDTKRITGDAMKEDGTVNRAALPAIFNPEDMNALEEALKIKETYGGTVTVVTMGPPNACEVLRESLFRGADDAVLITDRRAAASDTLATSYILSCAVKKFNPDIVLCGRQAIDGDTAQVGPQMAEKLGYTLITYLEEVKLDGKEITVRRNVGNGWEVVKGELPVLVTVMECNEPRPRAAKRMMKFKKARSAFEVGVDVKKSMKDATDEQRRAETDKRIKALEDKGLLLKSWNLDDIEADLQWCGMSGSPTKVHRIQSVVLAGGEYREFDASERGVAELIGELIEEHTIG
ncbi:MAG: electron transfer flavoprotein subunit beta/FixA family protein [Phycisphaerae bacterium]